MEWKDLSGFVLLVILVALILGVGLLTLDKFSVAAREDSGTINENISVSTLRNSDGEVAVGSISLVNNYLVSVSEILLLNSANETNYTLTDGVDYTYNTGEETANIDFKNTTAFTTISDQSGNTTTVLYVFKQSNDASTGISSTVTAMTPIATTWLPLIVTVAVLAIILGLVIRSFACKKR